MNDLRKDCQLKTIDEISARISSLKRLANELCERRDRTNTADAFNKRQARIAKLNARADSLHKRRAVMLRVRAAMLRVE